MRHTIPFRLGQRFQRDFPGRGPADGVDGGHFVGGETDGFDGGVAVGDFGGGEGLGAEGGGDGGVVGAGGPGGGVEGYIGGGVVIGVAVNVLDFTVVSRGEGMVEGIMGGGLGKGDGECGEGEEREE